MTASDNYFGLAFTRLRLHRIGLPVHVEQLRCRLTGSTRTATGCRITGNAIAGISIYGSTANTIANNLFQNKRTSSS